MSQASTDFEYLSQDAVTLGLIRDGERVGMQDSLTERVWVRAGQHIDPSQCEQMFASITRDKSLRSIFIGHFKPLGMRYRMARAGLECEPLHVLVMHLNGLLQENTRQIHRAVLDPENFEMPVRSDEVFAWSEFTQALIRTLIKQGVAEPEMGESFFGVDLGL
ncbi:hypothetical protein [Pseudomonas simiae]